MLNIIPLHDEARDCFDDIIASVAAWTSRDYELMYLNTWSFLYEPSSLSIAPLGNSINLISYNKYALLEKYHGIKLEFHSKESPEIMFLTIRRELSKNLPVAILVNAFWCPTCPGYHIKETQDVHFCLAVGLDSDTLHYVDPYYMKYNASITKDEFIKGYGGYVTFSFSSPEKPEIDWMTTIISTVSRLKTPSADINSFSMMREFSDHIRESLDMSLEEGAPGTSIDNFPIIKMLTDISRDRKQFCIVLDYIAEKYDVPILVESSLKLKNVSLKWGMVRALLCKSLLTSNSSAKLRNKIADKIRDISEDEEYIADNLIEFRSISNKSICLASKQISTYIIPSDITFVDLKKHFNSKSFCNSIRYNGTADFTGDGRFFLEDNIPDDNILNIDSMKFDVANITQNSNDNILCTGQLITAPRDRYKVLMILGSSDFSHMLDKIKVQYADGSEDEFELGLSFYRASEPIFHETPAYSGIFGTVVDGKVTSLPYSGNIYSQIYSLRGDRIIDSICLPYCPNMHVYAISLGQ